MQALCAHTLNVVARMIEAERLYPPGKDYQQKDPEDYERSMSSYQELMDLAEKVRKLAEPAELAEALQKIESVEEIKRELNLNPKPEQEG